MRDINSIIREYQSLNLHAVIDYDKFYHFSIVHHSSVIEGSTLTENETRLLLEEGITPKGKPLEHSLMVKDHYDALRYVLDAAGMKTPIIVDFIQSINAKVMKHTGGLYNTIFGEIDASKGMFRKGNVSAGGSYFVNFEKVERYTSELAGRLSDNLGAVNSLEEQLNLSFIAHFDLVSIHPFYDGNERSSRLLMNYIQSYFQLPLAIVYQEDKVDYFDALQQARKQENISVFTGFMLEQYKKFLLNEMQQFRKDMSSERPKKNNNGKGFSLFF